MGDGSLIATVVAAQGIVPEMGSEGGITAGTAQCITTVPAKYITGTTSAVEE
jgi:hypothetical protein